MYNVVVLITRLAAPRVFVKGIVPSRGLDVMNSCPECRSGARSHHRYIYLYIRIGIRKKPIGIKSFPHCVQLYIIHNNIIITRVTTYRYILNWLCNYNLYSAVGTYL